MGKTKNTGGAAGGSPNDIYTREELAAALVFFADKLDETIDAVFLAAADDGFLTLGYSAKLVELQDMARLAAETASLDLAGVSA